MLIILTIISSTNSLPYFYHTSSEILSQVKSLSCPNLEIVETNSIHAVKLGNYSSFNTFVVFGEHPRELITVEIALFLIQTLCELASIPSNLLIVLNANPSGRELAEQGDYCRRTNNNNVDLNRNWDFNWEVTDCMSSKQICSGPFAFSEEETNEIKDLLLQFHPDLFISVHSGINALMYPPAYSFKKNSNSKHFHEILSKLNTAEALNSQVGQTSLVLDYTASGNCLDFAFSKGAKFAFVFEVFEYSGISGNSHKWHKSHKSQSILNPSSDCFEFFNPSSHEEYLDLLSKWTQAILSTINLVCCYS